MKDDLQEVLWTVRTLADNYAEVPSPIVLELLELLDEEEDRDALAKEHVTASKTEPLDKETIMHDSTCPDWCTTIPAPHDDHRGGWDNKFWPDNDSGGEFEVHANLVQLGGETDTSVCITLDGQRTTDDLMSFTGSTDHLRAVAAFLLQVADSVDDHTR